MGLVVDVAVVAITLIAWIRLAGLVSLGSLL